MKKIFVLSLVASMFLFGCGPEETTGPDGGGSTDKLAVATVKKENKSLIAKFSGTNCPPCGTWGWTMMASLVDGAGTEAVTMTAYGQNFVAQLFITDEATTLQNAWGAAGYPHFGANGSVTTQDRSQGVYTALEEQEIFDRVNAHAASAVTANTTLNYEIVDGKLNMKYKTSAWGDISGTPYLAIYVLEDKVKGNQAGHSEGANAIHKKVLRGEVTASAGYGSEISGLAVGSDVSGEATYELDSDWDTDHIIVAPVMYSKVGTNYEFVNASFGTLVE